MARPRSHEIAVRDNEIRVKAGKGMSKTALAAMYGISVTRVCQILAEEVNVSDLEQRAWLLAAYQGGLDKLEEIIQTPGRPITSGKGDHVFDANTGQPAYDISPIVDAVRTKGQYLKSMAQLLGSEKMALKPLEKPFEFDGVIEDMRKETQENVHLKAQLSALRQRLAAMENGDVQIAEVVEDD